MAADGECGPWLRLVGVGEDVKVASLVDPRELSDPKWKRERESERGAVEGGGIEAESQCTRA